MEAIYRVEDAPRDGATSVETSAFAGGPWDPKLQHGAAPSSLIWTAAALTVVMKLSLLADDVGLACAFNFSKSA